MDGIVGRFTSRLGEGSFKDITCSSSFGSTFERTKLEGEKGREYGKYHELKKLHDDLV
jgi:hypothetical protein